MTIGVSGQIDQHGVVTLKRVLSRLLVLCLVGLALSALAAPAGAQEAINTVTVAATKQVDVEADIGRATFGVRVQARRASAATAELSAGTKAVLDALKDAGFTSDELSTADVRLYRTCLRRCHDRKRDGIPADRVMGYVGTAAVRLETEKLNKLGVAVDAAVSGGANSIRSISYDVRNKDAAVLEALRQAMRFAKAKAEVIAEEADRELGPAVIVEEGRTSAPDTFTFARDVQGDTLSGTGGAAAAIPFPVEPPTLKASARVTVTWELL